MRCIHILIFALLAFSCSDKKSEKKKSSEKEAVRDGVSKVYYSDGKLRAEVPVKGGKRNGLATEYYNSGKKHLVINYVDGQNHGLTTRYYENGNLYEETMYDQGEMHGTRKRYRQDGKLASVAQYNHGSPCAGLKEYLKDGSPKKNYPSIVVQPVDKTLTEDKFIIRISMSDKTKGVTFYEGKLDANKCIGYDLTEIPATIGKGVCELSFHIPKGMFTMQKVNIVAKVKTPQGNYFVTQTTYNAAIENR